MCYSAVILVVDSCKSKESDSTLTCKYASWKHKTACLLKLHMPLRYRAFYIPLLSAFNRSFNPEHSAFHSRSIYAGRCLLKRFRLSTLREGQTWVKSVTALDSNAFLYSIVLAWCTWPNQEDQKKGFAFLRAFHRFQYPRQAEWSWEEYLNPKRLRVWPRSVEGTITAGNGTTTFEWQAQVPNHYTKLPFKNRSHFAECCQYCSAVIYPVAFFS